MKRQGEENQVVLSEKRPKHELYVFDGPSNDDKNKQLLPVRDYFYIISKFSSHCFNKTDPETNIKA